jgi:hypothetical protein
VEKCTVVVYLCQRRFGKPQEKKEKAWINLWISLWINRPFLWKSGKNRLVNPKAAVLSPQYPHEAFGLRITPG